MSGLDLDICPFPDLTPKGQFPDLTPKGHVKQFLEREQKEFEESYDMKIANVAEEHKDEYIQWLGDTHWYLHEVFPSLQWMSLFNSSYTVFEKNINYMCEKAGRRVNAKITVKDISGQGIERAKIYLTKVVGIEEPFKTEKWQNIRKYADLRNVLAHASGELDLTKPNHKQVLDFAIKHPAIKVKYDEGYDFGEIALQSEVVMEAIAEFSGFIHLINQQDITSEAD